MGRVLVVGGVGRVGEGAGHRRERLQRGVSSIQAGAPPVVLLRPKQRVGEAVHGGRLQLGAVGSPQPPLQPQTGDPRAINQLSGAATIPGLPSARLFLLLTSHKGGENSRPDRENIVRIRPRLNQQAN